MVAASHLYTALLLALAVGGVLTATQDGQLRNGHRSGQRYGRRRGVGGRGGGGRGVGGRGGVGRGAEGRGPGGRGDGRGKVHNKNNGSNKEEKVSIREYVHAAQRRKQSVYCFQCAYSPDKDVYETIKAPTIVKDKLGRSRVVYRSRLMKVRKPGGWDKCVGPFGNADADEYGIDVKPCSNTCYARLETSGNIFRGCYEGAYGVDSHKYGCHEQQGSIWCFCKGHVCNNNEIEDTFNKPTEEPSAQELAKIKMVRSV